MALRLPGGLAPPLHILEPPPIGALLLLATLLAMLVFLVLRRRRIANRQPASSPRPKRQQPVPISTFEQRIRELEKKHLLARTYREGCYELAGVARRLWSEKGDSRPERLTALEIRRQLGDTVLSRFLLTLAELRFRSQEPEARELEEVCDLAIDASKKSVGSR